MTRTIPRHVVIWIDCQQTILFAFPGEQDDPSGASRQGDGWSQQRVDARECPSPPQYYDRVLALLEPQDQILILGPGQTKRELLQRIRQQDGFECELVGLRRSSRLPKVELVFPIDEIWPEERAGKVQVATPIVRPDLKPPGVNVAGDEFRATSDHLSAQFADLARSACAGTQCLAHGHLCRVAHGNPVGAVRQPAGMSTDTGVGKRALNNWLPEWERMI